MVGFFLKVLLVLASGEESVSERSLLDAMVKPDPIRKLSLTPFISADIARRVAEGVPLETVLDGGRDPRPPLLPPPFRVVCARREGVVGTALPGPSFLSTADLLFEVGWIGDGIALSRLALTVVSVVGGLLGVIASLKARISLMISRTSCRCCSMREKSSSIVAGCSGITKGSLPGCRAT